MQLPMIFWLLPIVVLTGEPRVLPIFALAWLFKKFLSFKLRNFLKSEQKSTRPTHPHFRLFFGCITTCDGYREQENLLIYSADCPAGIYIPHSYKTMWYETVPWGNRKEPIWEINPSYSARRVQDELKVHGWTMLSLDISQSSIRVGDEHYAGTWYDRSHPHHELVCQILAVLIINANKEFEIVHGHPFKTIFVIGDSTLAFSIDRYQDTTIEDLQDYIMEETGVLVIFRASSGSCFSERTPSQRDATKWGREIFSHSFISQVLGSKDHPLDPSVCVDAVLMVGGWNQTDTRQIQSLVKDLTEACHSKLR
jgi:hypothetical protein